jgi:hypothetical protein
VGSEAVLDSPWGVMEVSDMFTQPNDVGEAKMEVEREREKESNNGR